MIRSNVLALLGLSAVVAACGGETPPPAPPPPPPVQVPAASASTPTTAPSTPAATASAAAPEPPKPAAPPPAVTYKADFAKPESAQYDAANDRYLVSNINGIGAVKDNNGFISVLSPDGQVTNLKWIEGGKNKVTLDAPKGLAIVKGTLYAADITTVRMFDLKTGAPKGEIPVTGATFLNDLAVGPDGKIYVSDTGLKLGEGGALEPNGTDAVYVIEKGKAKVLAKGTDLGRPNGLAWSDKGLLVCSYAGNEIYRLDEKGAKQDVTKAPAGKLDGLLVLGDSLLVTSWEASAIFRGKLGGTFDVAIPDLKAPADIGYDTKRGRLLVPLLTENTVLAYDLK
jgi:sugar lactone lactonase YvrE